MKKFVDLCKKPLLIASAALFVVFAVLLVVALVTPLGKTYSYKKTAEYPGTETKVTYTQKFTIKSKEKLEVTSKYEMSDEVKDVFKKLGASDADIAKMEEGDTEEYDYVRDGNKLFLGYTQKDYDALTAEEKEELAKDEETLTFKGYKILANLPKSATETEEIAFVNTVNPAVIIASAVLMGVAGVAALGCVVVLVLDKKGVIKTGATKTEAAAE